MSEKDKRLLDSEASNDNDSNDSPNQTTPQNDQDRPTPEDIVKEIDPPQGNKAGVNLVLRQIDTEAGEENQSKALKAARLLLAPFRSKDVRIDKASLAKNDDLDLCNRFVRRGMMPTENYPSNVGYYGYDVRHEDGESIYSQSKIGKFLLGAEDFFYGTRDSGALFAKPKRKKIHGKNFEDRIMAHVRELGLEEYFYVSDNVEFIEKNEDIRSGIILDDLLRFHERDESQYSFLRLYADQIQEALKQTATMISEVHARSEVGIGELLANDIVLNVEDGKVFKARLTAPDVKYERGVDELEQKATDLSDLCFSVGSAGFQTGDEDLARHYIHTILQNYPNDFVKTALKSLVRTRPNYGYITNRPRLGFDRVQKPKAAFEKVREIVIGELEGVKQLSA